MDLKAEKAKRDARMKDKKERIKAQVGSTGVAEPAKLAETVSNGEAEADVKAKSNRKGVRAPKTQQDSSKPFQTEKPKQK